MRTWQLLLVAVLFAGALSGCTRTPSSATRAPSDPAATIAKLGIRPAAATTTAQARGVGSIIVRSLMPEFRADALRGDPKWKASGAVVGVEQSGPGRFRVSYEITVTTSLESRFRQVMNGAFEVGPNANPIRGWPSDWRLLDELRSLTPSQTTAFLGYVADNRNPSVKNLTPLNGAKDVSSTFGVAYAGKLITYALSRGYDPNGLLFARLDDRYHLLGWDNTTKRWVLLMTVPEKEVP